MPSQRFKVVVGLMASLTIATYLVEPYIGAHGLEAHRAAPPFALRTVDNSTFDLALENNGTVVILDFMATWCPPCREEVRELAAVRAAYASSRVLILSVDVDYSESAGQLRSWREAYVPVNGSTEAAGWYFAMDLPGDFVGPKYGANALPTVVLVDLAHGVAQTWIGGVQSPQIRAAVNEAL